MLPAARRIRRAEEFRTVLRARTRATSPTMVVSVAHLPGGSAPVPGDPAPPLPARAGFVVGRAVGGSVARHRVTRQLRHLVAPRLSTLPDGIGVVVRALPPAATAAPTRLRDDLDTTLHRALRGLGQRRGSASEVSL